MRRLVVQAGVLLELGLFGVAFTSSPQVAGQNTPPDLTGPQFGLGYVGNAPNAILGGAFYFVLPELGPIQGGVGLYLDAKFDIDDPTDDRGFNGSVTVQEILGDPLRESATFIRAEETYYSINLALVRPVTPFLMVYAGGGMAKMTRYELFNVAQDDPVGVGGVVLAENPNASATRGNLMVGILMRMTARFTAHFGFESEPRGVTAGLSLRLPRW